MRLKGRNIAAVQGTDSKGVQAFLSEMSDAWRAGGMKVIGVTAQGSGPPDRTCTAAFLHDILSGDRFQIYLDEQPTDTTCDLDARGVDAACAKLMEQIATGELVILSKFGKLEAEGCGLFPVFEAAMAAGLPTVTTVSPKHREAWQAFAPDAATLDADKTALADWLSPQRA